MSSDNVELVRQLCTAFLQGDMAAMFVGFAPDVVLYEAEGLPYAGVYQGIAGVQELLVKFSAFWDEAHITPERFLGEGDHVLIQLHFEGRVRSTGKQLSMGVIEHWLLRDGKVVELRPYYWDTAAIQAAAQ